MSFKCCCLVCIVALNLSVLPFRAESQTYVGIEFGAGENIQGGSFTDIKTSPAYPVSTFANGKGLGSLGSLFFESILGGDFFWGAKASLEFGKTQESVIALDSPIAYSPSGQPIQSYVGVNRTEALSFTHLCFTPYIQYRIPHTNFFCNLGPSVSFVLLERLKETQSLAVTSMTGPNGTTYDHLVFQDGSTTQEMHDQPGLVINGASIGLSAIIATGYDIELARYTLAPLITVEYPLSAVSNLWPEWKITSYYGSVSLKYKL